MISDKKREKHLKFLKDTLSEKQKKALKEVILSTDIEGDWNWNGEDSVFEDDITETLATLAHELCRECE